MATWMSTGSNSVTFARMDAQGIGQFVRERRARLGWTQERLSEETGISRARIAQIEGGRVALPGADFRRRLAAALGVDHLDMLIAAGELTEDEIRSAGVSRPQEHDPERAALLDRLRRVRLRRDRIETLEAVLDRWLQFDRKAADGVEKHVGRSDTDPLDDERG